MVSSWLWTPFMKQAQKWWPFWGTDLTDMGSTFSRWPHMTSYKPPLSWVLAPAVHTTASSNYFLSSLLDRGPLESSPISASTWLTGSLHSLSGGRGGVADSFLLSFLQLSYPSIQIISTRDKPVCFIGKYPANKWHATLSEKNIPQISKSDFFGAPFIWLSEERVYKFSKDKYSPFHKLCYFNHSLWIFSLPFT